MHNYFNGAWAGNISPLLFRGKAPVDTYNDLPVTNNEENDLRATKDTDHLYIWTKAASSGSLSDWKDIGSTVGDLDSIAEGSTYGRVLLSELFSGQVKRLDDGINEVTASDAKDAVDKKHVQNSDTKLDEGGANEIVASEITKKSIINREYYIDPVSGDDGNAGTELAPFRTIQHAIDITPKNLDSRYLCIYLMDGTYSETPKLEGFYGVGGIWIGGYSGDPTLARIQSSGYQIFDCMNNTTDIYIQDVSVKTTSNYSDCFRFYCSNAALYNVKVGDNGNTGTVGVLAFNSIIGIDIIADIDGNKVAFGYSSIDAVISISTEAVKIGDTHIKTGATGLVVTGAAPLELNSTTVHTQGTDTTLDLGGANEVSVADVKDAVDKKHNTHTANEVTNDSSVAGSKVKDALDSLLGDVKRIFTFTLPCTTIADSESIQLHRFTVPAGKSVKIWAAGLSSGAGSKVAGAKIQVYNVSDAQEEYSTNETIITGNPISTLTVAEKDITIKVLNASGLQGDFNGFLSISVE